jgi:hypothetical protein
MSGRNGTLGAGEQQPESRKGDLCGESLVAAMQASPFRAMEIEPGRWRSAVRDLDL